MKRTKLIFSPQFAKFLLTKKEGFTVIDLKPKRQGFEGEVVFVFESENSFEQAIEEFKVMAN